MTEHHLHNKNNYFISIVFAELVVFVSIALYNLTVGQNIGAWMTAYIFIYCIVYAMFIAVLSSFLGFPVFRKVIAKLHFNYFLNVLIAGMVSALIVSILLVISLFFIWSMTNNPIPSSTIFNSFILILAIGVVACIFYWNFTKPQAH